uniref:Uncharacterized protein n=1 Tax=Picea sitchensis TaxID=3332 RepID=D5A9H5_PICSI|nr:unknown [Picea sitchensis]
MSKAIGGACHPAGRRRSLQFQSRHLHSQLALFPALNRGSARCHLWLRRALRGGRGPVRKLFQSLLFRNIWVIGESCVSGSSLKFPIYV